MEVGQFVRSAPLCPRCRYVTMSGSVKPPLYWDQLLFCCKQSRAHKGAQILPLLFRQSRQFVCVHHVGPGCRVFFKKTQVLIPVSFLDDLGPHAVLSADDFHVCPLYNSVATDFNVWTISFSFTRGKLKSKKWIFLPILWPLSLIFNPFQELLHYKKCYILVLSSVLLSIQHQWKFPDSQRGCSLFTSRKWHSCLRCLARLTAAQQTCRYGEGNKHLLLWFHFVWPNFLVVTTIVSCGTRGHSAAPPNHVHTPQAWGQHQTGAY